MAKEKISGNNKIIDWIEFSMNPRTEDEIREACLDPAQRDKVCISYICKCSIMSCKFIEELIVLSSYLFDKNSYNNEESRKIVLYILQSENLEEKWKRVKEVEEKYANDPIIGSLLERHKKQVGQKRVKLNRRDTLLDEFDFRSKVDWYNILKCQSLEPWFVEKYKYFLENSRVALKKDAES